MRLKADAWKGEGELLMQLQLWPLLTLLGVLEQEWALRIVPVEAREMCTLVNQMQAAPREGITLGKAASSY